MDSQNEPAMQYGHMSLQDRRDTNLDSNGSTPFPAHQSLGQALGTHPHLQTQYARTQQDHYRHPSTSPPSLAPHPQPHQPITFAAVNGQASPALKRKQMDNQISVSMSKRRRDDDDSYDLDAGGAGAKHWTDDEKTRLFRWLMGPNNNEHWNSLRATKNSCLRECALEVFEGKKTYQALKGCYERNFNVFKQIYALEMFHGHPGPFQIHNEADRLREYERRLQLARKANCDVGNINARNIEHWFSRGWYELFFNRWNGDPATTKPVQMRGSTAAPVQHGGGEEPDEDEPPPPPPQNPSNPAMDFTPSDPTLLTNGLTNGLAHDRSSHSHPHQVNFINPQTLNNREVHQIHPPPPPQPSNGPVPVIPSPSTLQPGPQPPMPPHLNHPPHHPQTSSSNGNSQGDTPAIPIALTPNMVNAFMQYIQVQTQASKMKMEYLRRREEREEKEHRTRYEAEQLRLEKDRYELDQLKSTGMSKLKTERAFDLVSRTDIDPAVKKAASEYVRRILQEES